MMRLLKIIYSITLLTTVLTAVTVADEQEGPLKEASLELSETRIELEVHEKFDPTILVEDGEYQTLNLPFVDTDVVGEQVLTYQAGQGFSNVEKQVRLNIVDKTAPEFIKTIDTLTVDYGSKKVDIVKHFKAKDNYDDNVKIKQLQAVKTNEPGKQKITIEATDASENTQQHVVTVTVKPKPKPKVVNKPVSSNTSLKTTSNTKATSNSGQGTDVRITLYGANCLGCRPNKNGVSKTALGISVTTDSVRQANGTWTKGVTYAGRYIVATGSKWPLCTVGTVTNHSLSGQGIKPGVPFNVFVGDRGVSGNHVDVFAGNEKGYNGVRFTTRSVRGTFIVTGIAKRIANGCAF